MAESSTHSLRHTILGDIRPIRTEPGGRSERGSASIDRRAPAEGRALDEDNEDKSMEDGSKRDRTGHSGSRDIPE